MGTPDWKRDRRGFIGGDVSGNERWACVGKTVGTVAGQDQSGV